MPGATEYKKGKKSGPGRPPGMKNKVTTELKEMILQALDGVGGAEYLQTQANANPGAFMALVGKVLPLTIKGDGAGGAITIGWLQPPVK